MQPFGLIVLTLITVLFSEIVQIRSYIWNLRPKGAFLRTGSAFAYVN